MGFGVHIGSGPVPLHLELPSFLLGRMHARSQPLVALAVRGRAPGMEPQFFIENKYNGG